MTMLYVTHDQVEAMTMADQVVLMRNGRIEQDARPPRCTSGPRRSSRRASSARRR
jgi:sn-glycerol 3-phosphate transport system ATP-binding protein